MTLWALLFSVVVSTASLGWGYAHAAPPVFARWILAFGLLWLLAVWQRWRWFASIGLIFDLLAAAGGLWLLNFAPGWMFAGAIGGLMAFDLTDFRHRLSFAATADERRIVETRHLRRISLLALVGFALASLAMLIRLQFTFEWAVLLVVVAVIGITQLIAWFRASAR